MKILRFSDLWRYTDFVLLNEEGFLLLEDGEVYERPPLFQDVPYGTISILLDNDMKPFEEGLYVIKDRFLGGTAVLYKKIHRSDKIQGVRPGSLTQNSYEKRIIDLPSPYVAPVLVLQKFPYDREKALALEYPLVPIFKKGFGKYPKATKITPKRTDDIIIKEDACVLPIFT